LLDRLWSSREVQIETGEPADPEQRPLRIDPGVRPPAVPDGPRPPGRVPDSAGERVAGTRSTPPRPARDRRPARSRSRVARPGLLVVASLVALTLLGVLRVGSRASADVSVAVPTPSVELSVGATSTTTAGPEEADPASSPPASSGAGDTTDLLVDRGADIPDWAGVLAALDAGRRQALVEGSVDALRAVVAPDGAAWADDAALAARVSALHARIVGGALTVLEVRPTSTAAGRTDLLVRDRRSAYTVVTPDGSRDVPVREARWWRVTLVASPSTPAGWRVRDVAAVAAPSR
jgi:hypothetical protein